MLVPRVSYLRMGKSVRFASVRPGGIPLGRSVLVVPVQFLADHLEILYDVEVGAREQAERCGLGFHRIASLNDHPDLIEALARVVHRTLKPRRWAVSVARS